MIHILNIAVKMEEPSRRMRFARIGACDESYLESARPQCSA
jgi:hypothetical protein